MGGERSRVGGFGFWFLGRESGQHALPGKGAREQRSHDPSGREGDGCTLGGGGGGGGCLENRRVGVGLWMGGGGRARGGVCSGLGRVARHNGVRSVPRYCALPQHVSPKSRALLEPGPRLCCRCRGRLAGGGFRGWTAAHGAFGGPSGCCCAASRRAPCVRLAPRGVRALSHAGLGCGDGRCRGGGKQALTGTRRGGRCFGRCQCHCGLRGGPRLTAYWSSRLASGVGGGGGVLGPYGGGLPGGRVQRGARGGRHVDVREEPVGVQRFGAADLLGVQGGRVGEEDDRLVREGCGQEVEDGPRWG